MINWLNLLISEFHIYSVHLHLISIVKIKPNLFSPLARISLNPVIVGSTIILTGVDTESAFNTSLHGLKCWNFVYQILLVLLHVFQFNHETCVHQVLVNLPHPLLNQVAFPALAQIDFLRLSEIIPSVKNSTGSFKKDNSQLPFCSGCLSLHCS